MFGFKKKQTELQAFAIGKVIPLVDVADDVFSAKMMGDGFAIQPTSGQIIAPCEAIVTNIFPTKHAISLQTKQHAEILLHFGLDTVELEGLPFEIHVNEGDTISLGQELAQIDLALIQEKGKQTDLIFVIPDKMQYKELTIDYGSFEKGQKIGMIKY